MYYKLNLAICMLMATAIAAHSADTTDIIKTESRITHLYGHGAVVQSVAFSPDGKLIATGDWKGEINLYSVDSTIELIQTLYGHETVVTCLEFSRDSKKLISGGNDFQVITWKHTSDWVGFEMDKTSKPHTQPVSSVAYGPGMKMIFSAGADGKVIIKNLENNKDRVIEHKRTINDMIISSNRQFIYVADQGTTIQEYDMMGNKKRTFEGHKGEVLALAYAPNRQFLLTGSSDKSAIVWDLTKGKVKYELNRHSWKVNSVDISGDSKYGVTGGKDGFCYLWNIMDGTLLDSFQIEGGDITSVSFNNDNQYVVIGVRERQTETEDFGAIVWKTGLPSRFAKPKTPARAPVKDGKPPMRSQAPGKASGILPERPGLR